MAKIKLPLMSGQVSNKIGDVVYYRRGDFGINVARVRVIPRNPKTENQIAVRHNLKTLMQIWLGRISPAGQTLYKWNGTNWTTITIASTETFTDTDRQAWKTYVHTSKQGHRVTGRYSFVGVNMQRLYNNLNPWKRPNTEFSLAT